MTTPAPNTICPACDQHFVCGMVAGAAHCWCYALPHSLPVPSPVPAVPGDNPSSARCFCPVCLPGRLHGPATASPVATTPSTDFDGMP
ncbi:MAG: cysteine-rich CWC family protein [Polaromonas sp.]